MEFSLEQAMRAQAALRRDAGLAQERFPLMSVIGMLSDEIETLRNAGRSDEEIARTISDATGEMVTPRDVRENYASPDARHRHP